MSTSKKPLVSVVCTCYNKAKWIECAIKSVLDQKTDFPYELIVIDDASTDKSWKILKKYQEKYSDKIRIFQNKLNLGITKTWIKICHEAQGKYIARLDGDDYWTDNKKLQKQVDLLKKHPKSKWCNTDYDMMDSTGKIIHKSCFKNNNVFLPKSYEQMLISKGFTNASTWLVDTKLMQKINKLINKDAVDDTFNIQLELFQHTTLTFLPDSTTMNRNLEGSDSHPIDIKKIDQRQKRLLDTQIEFLNKYKGVGYGEMLELLLKRHTQLETTNIDLYMQHEELIQEYKKCQKLLKSAHKQYDDVINSRRWKLTSKIIKIFKRV